MGYLIGVDGGGTGCRVAVADGSGRILGRGESGAANIATNLLGAYDNILMATGQAFDQAGVQHDEIQTSTAVLGLAGANLGDYSIRLQPRLPFAKSEIVTDAQTTLTGAIGEADGCIAAIGTGSVFGQSEAGQFRQIGGWGFLLGDDGSGARLGRDLLHLSLLAHDKIIPHSPLTLEIMAEFENSPRKMVAIATGYSPGDFGGFAKRIVTAAKNHDIHAEALMAKHTDIVQRSIDAIGFDPCKAFCMLGGLGAVYLERLPERYRAAASPPLGHALDGAVLLAKRLAD